MKMRDFLKKTSPSGSLFYITLPKDLMKLRLPLLGELKVDNVGDKAVKYIYLQYWLFEKIYIFLFLPHVKAASTLLSEDGRPKSVIGRDAPTA